MISEPNKSVAPRNEASKKIRKNSSFVVLFRHITHLFGTYVLKENILAFILNAIAMSLLRLLEIRFEPLGNLKYMQL